jgi:hypothetical protein
MAAMHSRCTARDPLGTPWHASHPMHLPHQFTAVTTLTHVQPRTAPHQACNSPACHSPLQLLSAPSTRPTPPCCVFPCPPPLPLPLSPAPFRLQSELSYLKATGLHDKAVEAWQGLSELYHATQQWGKAVDADQQLVGAGVLAGGSQCGAAVC